jgi:hypothetical protein
MKISLALLGAVFADDEKDCMKCKNYLEEFNTWHSNDKITCSRYTDPRDQFSRGACKECKIQCIPTAEACPGAEDLEAGFWNRTGKKLQTQYVKRAEAMAAERAIQRKANSFAKETAKYEKAKKKAAEKAAKIENKTKKREDFQAWREEKRQKAEAARAQRKQEKKERKAAAKAAKELRKQQREQKRLLADQNKVLFAFYADLEEHYDTICPDMFLISDNKVARSFEKYLATSD